jgi:hypothetical protein
MTSSQISHHKFPKSNSHLAPADNTKSLHCFSSPHVYAARSGCRHQRHFGIKHHIAKKRESSATAKGKVRRNKSNSLVTSCCYIVGGSQCNLALVIDSKETCDYSVELFSFDSFRSCEKRQSSIPCKFADTVFAPRVVP